MNDELRAAQGAAAGGSTTEDARVECPKKIKNLEVAMSLSNHSTYREFCVSPSSFLLSVPELNIIFIIEQHKEICRDGGAQFLDKLVLSRIREDCKRFSNGKSLFFYFRFVRLT